MRRLGGVLLISTVVMTFAASCSARATDTTTTNAQLSSATVTVAATLPPPTTTLQLATDTTVEMTPTLPPQMEAKYPVVMTTGITGPDTQDIAVWEPDGDGPWPIVVLLHGWGARGIHYAATAELLAGQGVAVFAPDYRSTDIETANWRNVYRDVECAYRHVRTIAAEHNGDIDHPITVVGHSLGALVGMAVVLNESGFSPDGSFDGCPADTPRPGQIVALSGCYYDSDLGQATPFTPDTWGWTNHDANIELVVGSNDQVCEPWQSEDAGTQLTTSGYHSVEFQIIDDADHFSVIFTGYTNGPWYGPDVEWFARPNDPGGTKAAQIILDTITTATE